VTTERSVLLVEDDEATAELERRSLTRAGLRVQLVRRVHDAIEALQLSTFSAVLLDYQLPDADPWSVVAAAQARVPAVPVILVTGMGSEQVATSAFQRGVADYVRKTDAFWEQLPRVVDRVARLAEAELARRESENKFRTVVEHAPVAIFETDADGSCTFVNRHWVELAGITAERALGPGWAMALHPDDRERTWNAWNASAHGGPRFALDYRFQWADGKTVWVMGTAVATHDLAGNITGYLGTCIDISARALATEALKRSLAEKEVLLREIHHRVKNNLQVITSLINLQSHRVADGAARALFEDTRNRVHAIALLHEHLYRTQDLAHVDVAGYLRGLVQHIAGANRDDQRSITVNVEVRSAVLDIDSAVPVGLIVNELVSNAYKHAFPNGRSEGTITVEITTNGDQTRLCVTDDGGGFPENFALHSCNSLGMLLISSLAQQLDGALSVERRGGACCVVTFPTPRH
jgi:PAS domain S-box-containing protein